MKYLLQKTYVHNAYNFILCVVLFSMMPQSENKFKSDNKEFSNLNSVCIFMVVSDMLIGHIHQ